MSNFEVVGEEANSNTSMKPVRKWVERVVTRISREFDGEFFFLKEN